LALLQTPFKEDNMPNLVQVEHGLQNNMNTLSSEAPKTQKGPVEGGGDRTLAYHVEILKIRDLTKRPRSPQS
jgi:hypothetical protein